MNCPCISILQKKLDLKKLLFSSSRKLLKGMDSASGEAEQLRNLIRSINMEIYETERQMYELTNPASAPHGFVRSPCIGICANTMGYRPGLNVRKPIAN